MKYLRFNIRLYFLLTGAFIIMTVIGTLSHELGHYTVARLLGYEASINYQSCRHWNPQTDDYLMDTYVQHKKEIKSGKDFPGREKYLTLSDVRRRDDLLILIGGPMQTILTGLTGLLLLLVFKRRVRDKDGITFLGWVFIFLTLFWLRQLSNFVVGVAIFFIRGTSPFRGDEVRIAHYLNINFWSIQSITAVAAIMVLLYVLSMIPRNQVFTFLLAGLTGGVAGYYIWLIKLGHVIMP
jgi:hypothetical protein